MAIAALTYSFSGLYLEQQDKYLSTGDGAGLALTVTFYTILLLPVLLSFLVLGYLLSDLPLKKATLQLFETIFIIGSLISGVFVVSTMTYLIILPTVEQGQFLIYGQTLIYLLPPTLLFVLTLLAYRKTRLTLKRIKA